MRVTVVLLSVVPSPSCPWLLRPHAYTVPLAVKAASRASARSGSGPEGRAHGDGSWRGGAVELAARYDGLWLGRGASDVRAGGAQGGALAVKWWPADFLSAALAGSVTRYDSAPVEEPGRLWSWGVIARASFFSGLPGL